MIRLSERSINFCLSFTAYLLSCLLSPGFWETKMIGYLYCFQIYMYCFIQTTSSGYFCMIFSIVCPLITLKCWNDQFCWTSTIMFANLHLSCSVSIYSFLFSLCHFSFSYSLTCSSLSKAGQCFSDYSCFGKVGRLFNKTFLLLFYSLWFLLFSTLLCCVCIVYILQFICLCSLAWKHASSRKSDACHLCKPTLYISVSDFSWSLATYMLSDWVHLWLCCFFCFSMTYTVLFFREILLVMQYCRDCGFCVSFLYSGYSWSWHTCTVLPSSYGCISLLPLMPCLQAFPMFKIDIIFSWFLGLC